jgi:surface protein
MFAGNATFNDPDIASWNVSTVTNMVSAFTNCTAFNQPIGTWDVSNVTNMGGMFYGANTTSFNQSIGGWDVSNVTNLDFFFGVSIDEPLDRSNMNLSGWSVPNITTVPQEWIPLGGDPVWGATQTPLITTWTNTNNATFTIFNENDLQADAVIDWGDGTREVLIIDEFIVTEFNNRIIHSFPSTGTYTVTIRGYLPNFQGNLSDLFLGGPTPSPSSVGLTAVTEWNSTTVSLVGAFHRASALTSVPDYLPPSVVNTTSMFFDAVSINDPNIALWDVSNVTEMFAMFYNAISFNQDLSGWCVLNIGGDPSGFSDGATSWTRPKPVWETCPVRITTSNYVLGYFVDDGANSYFQVTSPDQNIQNLVSGDLVIITFFDSPSITITITYVFFNEGPGEWLIGFTTEDPIPGFVSAETQSVMTIFKTG